MQVFFGIELGLLVPLDPNVTLRVTM